MANISKRGDGYRIRVYVGEDVNGKQLFKSMTWTPDAGMTARQIEKELNRQATLFEEKVKSGYCTDSNIKFKDFCEKWFADYAETTLKPRTVHNYKELTKRVYVALGHIPLNKLRPTHLIEFTKQLAQPGIRGIQGVPNKEGKVTRKQSDKPLSPKTIKNYLMFVSSVLGTAVEWGFIESNPAAKVKPPKQEHKRLQIMDDTQIKAFIDSLDSESLERRLIFYLLIFTGMRRGELLGLEWADIDWENSTIHIRRTSQYAPQLGVFEDTTKTEGSNRSIKTSPAIISMLKAYRAEQSLRKLQLGDLWQNEADRIFTRWNGAPMHPNTPYNMLQKILKKNGMEYVSLHSLRHSNATILINSGASVKAVSARLGHSNVSTTLNIYTEQIKSADAAAAEAIDNVLLSENKPTTA